MPLIPPCQVSPENLLPSHQIFTSPKTYVNLMCISNYMFTRLLGRFAPIFYLNCEHVLIVNIEHFFGSRGSAVLTFIGYKQTDRQVKYIYRYYKGDLNSHVFYNSKNISTLGIHNKTLY